MNDERERLRQQFGAVFIEIEEEKALSRFSAKTATDEEAVEQIQIMATNVHIGNVARTFNELMQLQDISAVKLVRDVNRVAQHYHTLTSLLDAEQLPHEFKESIEETTNRLLDHAANHPTLLVPRKRSNRILPAGQTFVIQQTGEEFVDYFDVIAIAQNK